MTILREFLALFKVRYWTFRHCSCDPEHVRPYVSSDSGTQNRFNIGTRCLRYVHPSVNKPRLASFLQDPDSKEHDSSEMQQRRPFPKVN